MKIVFVFLSVSFFVTSCSTIENATAKWKTPEAKEDQLKEGEKSNYLSTEPTQEKSKIPTNPAKRTPKKKIKPKK